MFEIKRSDFGSLILPASAAANPCDNDGVLSDSEPHIQSCILQGVATACGVPGLTDAQSALVRSTFGQPDSKMSMDLFEKIASDAILGQNLRSQGLTKGDFVPYFVEMRRAVWEAWTRDGLVQAKPDAIDYLKEFRSSQRLIGLVTGMPFELASTSVKNILRADDIIPADRQRRVCCDDPRLGEFQKPHPMPYDLAVSHFAERYDIDPRDMWAVEDRANGAVSALRATYNGSNLKYVGHKIGRVIVIPDEHDSVPLELWDKKNLMESHLAANPEDRQRLNFLKSLADLSFVR